MIMFIGIIFCANNNMICSNLCVPIDNSLRNSDIYSYSFLIFRVEMKHMTYMC